MNGTVVIRRYRFGEEPALFKVFHSAIHLVARRDYSNEQIKAWAPLDLDCYAPRKFRQLEPR